MNYWKGDLGIIQCSQNIPPGGARSKYLSNRLNAIFTFSTFKNTMPALGQVLYLSRSVGAGIHNNN